MDEDSYPQLPIDYAEEEPLLYFPKGQQAKNESLVIRTLNGTWVDIVFVVTEAGSPPHPMHKHSNKVRKASAHIPLRPYKC